MKKFIINIIAITGLIITVITSGCSMQRHPKRIRSYNSYHYYHQSDGNYDRAHRYTLPRQY